MGSDQFEIIVVDDASADNTRETVETLTREIPNLRYVHQERAGLSAARNRGVLESTAPLVAFLDDDALASNCWLTAIFNAFNRLPRPACVGGPVEPWWEIPKPAWFPASLLGCHNRDYGRHARSYVYPAEHPIGCNMAFAKDWIDRVGAFNVRLENYNDETELLRRIAEAGGGIFYEPRAAVQHLVASERLTIGWQLRRHYHEGISLAVAAASRICPSRRRRMAELGRNLLSIAKRAAGLIVSRGPLTDRVQRLATLSSSIGKAVYLTKSLRQP